MATFTWNEVKERAALEVAEDTLTNEQIAQNAGVKRQTLDFWKRDPAFQERVASIVEATRQAVLSQGIADRVKRVKRLNRDWERMQRVIDSRANLAYARTLARRAEAAKEKPELADAPVEMFEESGGLLTGLVVVKETPSEFGVKREYQVDAGLLAELRNTERQAAQELGQWVEKSETENKGAVAVKVLSGVSLTDL